jgi:hypothetical protein
MHCFGMCMQRTTVTVHTGDSSCTCTFYAMQFTAKSNDLPTGSTCTTIMKSSAFYSVQYEGTVHQLDNA